MSAKFVIGIDLGTTNSVLAFAPLDADQPKLELLPIPQLVASATTETRNGLPSFLYLAPKQEAAGGSLDLPWAEAREFAVGEYARRQAAEMPDRTVAAAKSWLCHSSVDRHQPILPWNASAEIPKVSPVTATQRFLEHLVGAWETAHPESPIAEQQVVLTVPASFDSSARDLTREAALAAGLPADLVLIEEPQAAVYAWLASTGDRWRKALSVGDTLLVCDVGGGTTDLTLVGVAEEQGELVLRRMAVGNHLLVGGDNMDLALAHRVAGLFAEKGVSLDPWQSVALWHSCRTAKETLLAPKGPETHSISVLGRGRKLIGGTVSVEVDRREISELLVDGFFPRCQPTDRPKRQRASGFREIGLPFESDTAITRHLAAFLQSHGEEAGKPVRPTHVLLNGGVFKSQSMQQRLLEVLGEWFGETNNNVLSGADIPVCHKSNFIPGRQECLPHCDEKCGLGAPRLLEGRQDLDHAVALGAACYGWTKHLGGVRIRGGTARAYYVGIETSGLAVPGAPRPLRALCVAPIGMEEGTECDVPSGEIGLVVGEPAHFRFFSSSVRKNDSPGDLLSSWTPDELPETDSLEAVLPPDETIDEPYVPVRFRSKLTELGVLELWCVNAASDKRWKLEFSVREEGGVNGSTAPHATKGL